MKRLFLYIIIGILACVCFVCGALLYRNLSEQSKFSADIDALTELIDPPTPEHSASKPPKADMEATNEQTGQYESPELEKPHIEDPQGREDDAYDNGNTVPDYSKLYEMNADFAGWLTIHGTSVNYPVMQSLEDPNYYLYRGFNKKYSKYGLPFVAEGCDINNETDNILIYGHHMKDGGVFGALMAYEDPSFYEQNSVIRFDTLEESCEYQVFAVFKTTATDEGFRYYDNIHLEDPEVFNEFVAAVNDAALYHTNVTPVYGTRLLTLSTCEYSTPDGRLVVVAQQLQKN